MPDKTGSTAKVAAASGETAPVDKTQAPAKPAPAVKASPLVVAHPKRDRALAAARRNRLVRASFVAMVAAPTLAAFAYLYFFAANQYASTVAFSVRGHEAAAPMELFGALTQNIGGAGPDAQIVYAFIDSQQMVEAALEALPLRDYYNAPEIDVVFRLGEDRSVEDVHDYWSWMTSASYNSASGVVNFTARAFDPDAARRITQFVLDESSRIVNALSRRARDDAVKIARLSLTEAEDRLRLVRQRLRAFRRAEQEVDPSANAQAALALVSSLEEKLTETRVELDTQLALVGERSPQAPYLRQRIVSLEAQIAEERQRVGAAVGSVGAAPRATADVLAEYEEMVVDRDFAEKAYVSALASFEQAQVEARRQMRYLAPHIEPTLAEEPRYPQRLLIGLATFFFATVIWAVAVLIAYNIRDRR